MKIGGNLNCLYSPSGLMIWSADFEYGRQDRPERLRKAAFPAFKNVPKRSTAGVPKEDYPRKPKPITSIAIRCSVGIVMSPDWGGWPQALRREDAHPASGRLMRPRLFTPRKSGSSDAYFSQKGTGINVAALAKVVPVPF
jgi:hypothetical protein